MTSKEKENWQAKLAEHLAAKDAEIARLTARVRELEGELEASMWLSKNTPTNAELREMAKNSTPPPELDGVQEEKPW